MKWMNDLAWQEGSPMSYNPSLAQISLPDLAVAWI